MLFLIRFKPSKAKRAFEFLSWVETKMTDLENVMNKCARKIRIKNLHTLKEKPERQKIRFHTEVEKRQTLRPLTDVHNRSKDSINRSKAWHIIRHQHPITTDAR
jgi:hypothetical protein